MRDHARNLILRRYTAQNNHVNKMDSQYFIISISP